ncbi:hypothetical protein FGL89_06105 [Leuconostoc carnosum]|uniref:Uncharacterized protein n=2 Tax=Leuconostoc carnosum TaxID=1252 RepID=K0D8J8_LEUCJ|nr:hypothetical protein [Leuconostoc carnosum]AFT82249.1 hypothetical protein C270_06700 [Leuconostoc carnosum JB16]QEA33720.1 hypothetical protein FGL89_06105 [Leuconostoc carnosum]
MIIVLKFNKPAFVLSESLIALSLISLALAVEYDQVKNFNRQKQRLQLKEKRVQLERIATINVWNDYVDKK